MIHLSRPCIGDEEIHAVTNVLKSGWLNSGQSVKTFEDAFAKYIGVTYAVAVNSCTSALQLAIQAQGLKGEIILPSFTFVASVNAIINAGCVPRFVDIEYESCTINPNRIEKAISHKTVAIMPVHYAGRGCDMEQIMNIARRHNLTVIEDSAQAIGATYRGRKTGSFGIGCFSFFPTKNMTCGEGGMITLNDKSLTKKIRAYSSHGIEKAAHSLPWHREAHYVGYNFRMSNIVAALGHVQLEKLDAMNRRRREHAAYLNEHLKDVECIKLPHDVDSNSYHVYQMYTIKVDCKYINRNDFIKELRADGVEASVHFDPP
ncbi:MAG: DegT/DnrJ/EryC1/StrS family aminotransferase, partial [Candidatus Omnitrophica bacterium]|nr:DegT/DnrJ/EryC1/StrS family aminotransferase [Candidatus Omnitrophota bacterium]